MQDRQYQTEAIEWLCGTKRGIIKCPAGGGKTRIGATAICRVATSCPRERKARVTWLANTEDQVEQAKTALAQFPEIETYCRVRVACWQSGLDCAGEDLLVVDECHHAASPKLSAMVSGCEGARWGLSATPFGNDPDKNRLMLELFGWNLFEVQRERLVENGHLAKAKVIIHHDTDQGIQEQINSELPRLLAERMKAMPWLDVEEQRKRILWQLCQKHGVFGNQARNQKITSLAGEATLILVGTVEHGETLAQSIQGAVVCHAGMGKRKRRDAMEAFRTGTLEVMIATSLADEGLDVPRASTLVYACAGRSSRAAEQRTGRVLRLFEGKEHGMIHEFSDKQHPMLHAQHKSRIRLYKKLNYEISE